MQKLTAIRIAKVLGYILLGLATMALAVSLSLILTPLAPGTGSIHGPPRSISQLWFWGGGGVVLVLCLGTFLSRHRTRYLTILSVSCGILLTVGWIRSYGTSYFCNFVTRPIFLDHYETRSFIIQTGDGGLGFVYQEAEYWLHYQYEGEPDRLSGVLVDAWRFRPTPEISHYPAWNERMAIGKNSWLDKIGIKFWAQDIGIKGIPTSKYHCFRGMAIPYWLFLFFCLIAPSFYALKIIRQCRRRRLGLCAKCGYDLRGNITDKCPECGTVISHRKDATPTGGLPRPSQSPPAVNKSTETTQPLA